MNVDAAVMNIPYFEAREQFQHYRALVKERPKQATADDVSLYRALWQITRGQKVIDIYKAIESGGLDDHSRPKLAVGRADWPNVNLWTRDGRYMFSNRTKPWNFSQRQRTLKDEICVRFGAAGGEISGRAQTPMVPAQHRPKGSLSGYFILWEAEWQRVPPVDPMLLRRIDGPFFVVLAAWDLTPLEQAVLRQRL